MGGKDLVVIFVLIGLFIGSFRFLSQEELYDCMDNSCCSLRTVRGGEVNLFGSIGNFGVKTTDLFDYFAYGVTESCRHFMMSCNLIDASEIRISRDKLYAFRNDQFKSAINISCPLLDFQTSSGDKYSLDELKGEKVALMFVDLRYSNSIDHLLNIRELKRQFGEDDIIIVPICLNYSSKEAVAHPDVLAKKLQLNYSLTTIDQEEDVNGINPNKRSVTVLVTENGLIADIIDETTNLAFLQSSIERFLQ